MQIVLKKILKTKRGEYYKNNIEENSFELITIGEIKSEKIDMLAETAEEYKQRKINELKNKLNDEDMKFVLQYMKN